MVGAAGGPASLPSQARSLTGRMIPAWLAAQAIVCAAPGRRTAVAVMTAPG
jgi:hypothetical protein